MFQPKLARVNKCEGETLYNRDASCNALQSLVVNFESLAKLPGLF